jgi:hypothetical protein
MPTIAVCEWLDGGLSVGFFDGGEVVDGVEFIRVGLSYDGCQIAAIRRIRRSELKDVGFIHPELVRRMGI